MKFTLYIAALISTLFLSACSTTEQVEKATAKAQTNYNTCQANYYKASELVKVELTDDGKVKSMAVGNQNLQACQMAQAPKPAAVAMVEVIGSVANNALNVAASSVPYVAMAKIASDGIKSSGGNTYNDGSFNSHAEANQQTTTNSTETVSGIKAGNDVDQSQQNQNNPATSTTNTDNNSVNDSNNGGNDNSSAVSQEAEVTAAENEAE
jgi:hypothetical protein